MARYRENEFKRELIRNVESFDDILDLLGEVKRKSSSASAHKILDKILSIIQIRRVDSFNVIQKINRTAPDEDREKNDDNNISI